MGKHFFSAPRWKSLIFAVLILFGFYFSSLYNYLLFHSLAEIFSIVIAWSIFMIAWNSRQSLDHNYFLFIGIAYLFIGGLDLVHTLAYTGMGIFHGYDSNLPTQLWIAARFIESISLFAAPFFFKKKGNTKIIFWGYLSLFIVSLFLIFSRIFPVCFIEGTGLTPFKKTGEYIIIMILAGAAITLSKKRNELDSAVYRFLIVSILLTICAEMSFTFYIHVYGFSNLIGHYLKILSFYFIYKATFETGFIQPYDLLFKNFKKNQSALKENEKKFRLLCENAPLGYQSLDMDSNFLEVNLTWLKLLGYKRKEVIGKSFNNFLTPESRSHFKENFFRFKAQGEVSGVEFEMVKKDTSILLVLFNGKIGYDQANKFKQTHCILRDVTEVRHFEKILAQSEERYRGLFLNMGAGVAIYKVIGEGEDFIFMDLNQAAEKIENQNRNAIIGKSVFEVRPGVEQFGLIDVFRTVWKTGQPRHYPITLYQDETLEAWYENFVYKLPTGEIVAIYTDETKKHRTQMALQNSELRYRSLINEMLNGFSLHESICDKEGNPCDYRFLQVNRAFENMTGLKAKNIIGKTVLEILPGTEHYWIDDFGKVALTGKPMTFEKFAKNQDKYFEVLAYSPKIGQFAVVFTDVTLRRKTEKALLESETKYRSMMKTLKDAVYICSPDLKIEYMNPAMVKKTGRDATGKICYQALYGRDKKCSWCVLDQIQKGEHIDYELADPKGKLFYQVSNSPIAYGNESIGKLTIFHDITQQKITQDALKKSAEELRQLASRLTYIEEAERKKLALELHDRVGQNLTALNINLSIIKNLLPSTSADRILDRLSDSMALTDDTFKQVRDVMVDLRPEALDDYGLFAALGMYCEKFETRYGIKTQIKGCEFTHRLESEMETVLFRIAQEAMINTVRHARANSIALMFESTDTYDRLTIADNGTGFDPTQLNRAGIDTGWGLTIMQERASAIGMNFWIESGQGRGTKVIIEKIKDTYDD